MSRLRHLAVYTFYFLIALVLVGHMPDVLLNNFIGSDTGDSYEMARNVWWFKFAIQNGEPLFYQTWLGYPDGINGIILLSLPLQYFPMWGFAFFMPLAVAYNLTVLLWMALNAWTMFFLMRYLLDDNSWIAALLAGLVYMAFPLFQGHLAEGHGGLMVAFAPPLYIWALFRFTDAKEHIWRWLLTTILFFYLSTTGHILQSIYVLIPVTGTFLLGKLWLRDWQSVRRIIGMGIIASIVLLLVLFPAILDATGSSYSSTGGFTRYSADLLAIVSPSFLHPTFDTLIAYPRAVLGTNLGEGLAYIGIIASSLSIIGIITTKETRWWLLLAVIAWIFSLGPTLKIFDKPIVIAGNTIPLPFALFQNLPGFNLARSPGRFNFTLAIALAVIVGYGAAWLWQNRSGKLPYAIAVILAIGVLWEYQSFWGQPLRTAEMPDAVLALAEDDSVRAVFNIPYQHALAAKDALYLQTGHELPLIAGQITRTTPVNPVKLAMLQATLDPVLLYDTGADIVILHRARANEIGNSVKLEILANQQLGTAIYSDERIAIYRVPVSPSEKTLSYDFERPLIALSGDMNLIGTAIYQWDNQVHIWLQWQFDSNRPDSDIRFVHILDENGDIILQDDSSLGGIFDGEVRAELVSFDISNLEASSYQVRVGWYDFNSLSNYVTEDAQAAIIIGQIEN